MLPSTNSFKKHFLFDKLSKFSIIFFRNKDHPKLYLWAQPWNKKNEPEVPNLDVPSNVEPKEEAKTMG
jgi:hypothetical protein